MDEQAETGFEPVAIIGVGVHGRYSGQWLAVDEAGHVEPVGQAVPGSETPSLDAEQAD